ncbi:MAG: hypothetical protein A2X64_04365 [Ignavibacteria bacterium GWF2_33_9]|nr:MAG: hypothetical protein A2X64_04365 [Ignavibacteria bacterium GWF2_33_9]
MDRKSILALVLISAIVIGWMIYMSVSVKPVPEQEKYKTELTDSTTTDTTKNLNNQDTQKDSTPVGSDSTLTLQNKSDLEKLTKFGPFASFAEGTRNLITVETELTKIQFLNKGASIKRFVLKNYKKWDKTPTQLINNKNGELFITFRTNQGQIIDTRDLYFTTDFNQGSVKLGPKDSLLIPFILQVDSDSRIIKNIVIYGSSYQFREDIILENMEEYIPQRGYKLVWENGLTPQEQNSVDESNSSYAEVSMNGDLDDLSADEDGVQESYTGLIDFAGVKSKYFTAAIIPSPYKSFDGTVDLSGKSLLHKNEGKTNVYTVEFRIPYDGGRSEKFFNIYVGPLDYKIAKEYGLQGLVDLGWKYGIRQIGEYFMLPIFNLIHKFIHNYGISIILFAILIKFLLYPLSIGQMRSAKKMKLVAPLVAEAREKYKDDMTKQQQETMKIYQQYGINPAGGCLPLLLQMPILYALWSVLRSAIELRQAPFLLWINDLSVPDTIINFGFSFMGIKSLSGLALLMGATMFIQQKQTITDPRQKAMVYVMPVMLTLLFNSLPSGLNLYYFTFNLVSILMQIYINKFSKYQPTLEELKKAPKKEGWLAKKMREAQEIAAKQGRTVPGQKKPAPQIGTKKVNQAKPKRKK